MKRGFALGMAVFFIALGAVVISLMSCGGGGGGSSTGGSPSADKGSVAVLLADGPADDYEHIWVTITEVSLIPAGGIGAPVVIFQSPGLEVDLLQYREQDYLLTMKKEVPAGPYAKIRLGISQVRPEGGPCADMTVKLPSGKIDLNPRQPFSVNGGRTLAIRLDIDANKSINLHQAGKSGKCIFRPVVFVDIQEQMPVARCPKVLSGTIESLVKDGDQVVGFVLNLPDNRGRIEVSLPSDAAVINNQGLCAVPNDLASGDQVKVRGKLASSGVFEASLVVVGEILDVMGTVDTAPESSGNGFTFNFTPLEGQEIIGPLPVHVQPCTLNLIRCDTAVDPAAIEAGMKVRIFGKVAGESGLWAAAIILLEEEIVGEITLIEKRTDGVLATIQQNGGSVSVLIPNGTPIFLQGDGAVPLNLLCAGQQVRVFLKPGFKDPLIAAQVKVESVKHEGTVQSIDSGSRTLTVDLGGDLTETVYVEPGATILKSQGGDQILVSFEDIKADDSIAYFGLVGCTDTQFPAFVVVIGE